MTPTSEQLKEKNLKISLKKSNPSKKVMSDTKECCVCYEATEHSTPCNHLVCESCFPRLNACPMCRVPLGNGIPPMGFSLDEIYWGMAEAAFFGYLDIVRLMLFRGANNYNTGLMTSASGGHLYIVLLMLQQGANNFSHSMVAAAYNGHEDIVRFMLFKGATDYNTGLTSAASGGYESIVRLMLELGANNFNTAIDRAALRGHQNIVELIWERMNSHHLNFLNII